MQNPSDKELDDLFRRAAQQSEAEADSSGDPGDWQAMAEMMESNKSATRWTFGLRNSVIIILLMGLMGLIWYGIDTVTSMQADIVGASDARAADQPLAGDSVVPNDNATAQIIQPIPKDELETSAKEHTPGTHSFQKPAAAHSLPLIDDSNRMAINAPVEPGLMESSNAIKLAQPPIGVNQIIADSADIVEHTSAPDVQSLMEEKVQTKNSKGVRSLSFRILVSPDYSSVNSTNPGQLGFNVGAVFEYRFSERLTLSTGLIRARKVYTATNLEYNGYYADEVDGDCRMWDIPLNVYYNITPPERAWSFHVGAGLSSYLMSEENYVYKFQSGYGWYTYDEQIRNKNNEWFSMLNLSVGIQKNLTSRLAVQVEPYVKAPLAGVGEGDVSLASFGAFFSLRYHLFQSIK